IKKTALVIEFAISRFTGIERQIDIKTNRYCVNGNYDQDLNVPYPNGDNLLRELQTAGWDASFLPIVIGATGEVLLVWIKGLIALLPCTLLCFKVGAWMIASGVQPTVRRYADFIDYYRDQVRRDRLIYFLDLTNRLVNDCSHEQKKS
ncbi:unnamed protein product, partial [Rotaria magnacalcarata]